MSTMGKAMSRPLLGPRSTGNSSTARIVALALLVLVATLGGVLLAASLLPTAALAGRALGVAGEARSGTYSQELVAYLGARLRFSAVGLLGLTAGLVVLRAPLEDLIGSVMRDIRAPSTPWRWPARVDLLAIGLPLLVAVGLRAMFLSQPMRYDEALTFNEFASRPLYYGLSFYPDPNNHLLNTLLMHVTYLALGNQPWVLRLPAFLGGVLLVPATYALGRLLYGNLAAVLSAVLVAVSSYLIEYSTNARGYTLQTLCFVVLLALVLVAVRRDSPTALLTAALVAAVGAYAVPTMLYAVLVAGAVAVIEARRTRLERIGARHFVVSGLLLGLGVLLAYLPVVLISGPDKLVLNRFVVPLDAQQLARELPQSLAQTWTLWNRDVPLPLAALVLGGFASASLVEARRGRVPLGVLAPGVCLAVVLLQRVAPFERVWLFLLPLYFVIASGGLASLVDGRWLGLVFGAILAFTTLTSGSILASPETGTFADAEAVARTLEGRLAADDAVVTTLPASLPELQYYFPRSGLATDSLVRAPENARRVFVVAALDASPNLGGRTMGEEVARLRSSKLLEYK